MTMFSVRDEIQRLVPADLETGLDPVSTRAGVAMNEWEEVIKNLARLGKQQWRMNQQFELVADQARSALDEVRRDAITLRDQLDELRRENVRLHDDTRATALRILMFIDALDDVGVLAKQRAEAQWLKYVDRLTHDAMAMLHSIGLTEIVALGRSFDSEEHEALDTVERPDGSSQYEIVEVVQRGFRYHGRVLRRA